MIALETILLVWLVAGTALHIYTLKVGRENGLDEEDTLDGVCQKHGLPLIIGKVTSYIITLFIGLPFFIYKCIAYMLSGRSGLDE